MMPRLLVISPHFPPLNAPDMQRVRMSLPHWVEAGWEITVLTVDDPTPLAPFEPELLETIPTVVRVVRPRAFSRRWTRWLGVGNLGWRAVLPLYRAGTRLLQRERFDVLYFSTTQFIVCPLGRIWSERFGVPFVLDLQDPWLSDYYERSGARPPGGWKYRFARANARFLEQWTLRRVAHVISVSPAYSEALARRYPWFDRESTTTLPFGAPDRDVAIAQQKHRDTTNARLLPPTVERKIAYAGRLGPDMQPALDVLFAAIALARQRGHPWRLFFFGTSYAPAGRGECFTTVLAERHGIADLVTESPDRIAYLDSLRLLLESDVCLLLGSDDAAYSPSKIYPTLLAGRPIVAVAPIGSVLAARLAQLGGTKPVTFALDARAGADAVPVLAAQLEALARGDAQLSQSLPEDYLAMNGADAVAQAQLDVFSAVMRTAPMRR